MSNLEVTPTPYDSTAPTDPTVKELVLAAGRQGVSVSTVSPPPWTTKTEIDDDPYSLSVRHMHEFKSGKFGVGIEKFIATVDLGTTASLWWDSFDPTGAGGVVTFTVNMTDIPELIVALQEAHDAVNGVHDRVLRRAANVDAELQRLDA
ncbi:hypothetical protein [Microbacterium sp. MYb66]|uniref:hypothetical protein n=1 Tax=Microbacterium sp. MYb66 TaxID=1848692 RepID=UPI000D001474|nr:hypothetical protein [Microbacterium sp. MYb66]PRA83504.1 hypothetical protein CQ045_03790 [Microbacterium sp. MYb66]